MKDKSSYSNLHPIAQRIVQAIHPKRIILFGSRGRGDAEPDSDYDLLIIYDGTKSKREIDMEVRRLFRPPEFSLDIFIVTLEEWERFKYIANTLEREAAETGIALYG